MVFLILCLIENGLQTRTDVQEPATTSTQNPEDARRRARRQSQQPVFETNYRQPPGGPTSARQRQQQNSKANNLSLYLSIYLFKHLPLSLLLCHTSLHTKS